MSHMLKFPIKYKRLIYEKMLMEKHQNVHCSGIYIWKHPVPHRLNLIRPCKHDTSAPGYKVESESGIAQRTVHRLAAGQNIHEHNRHVKGFIYLRSSEVTAVVWWYSKPYQTQTYLLRQSIDWYVMLWMVSSVPCRRLLATVWQLLVASETCYRDHSRFAHSQWERALLCNDVSHWLGASLAPAP